MKSPVIRAPQGLKLKLSREMKVLLLLLVLVALIGGGYVWLSTRHTQALAQSVPTPGTDPAGSPASGTEVGQAAPDAGLKVQPDGQVDVPSIPAFGADPADAATDAPVAPPPGGINPDTPLAALPPRNPFRPLALAASEAPASAPAAPVSAPPITVTRTAPPEPTSLPVPEPVSVPTGADDTAPAASPAPLVLPPLPRTSTPVEVASAPVSGGALPGPVTVIPAPATPRAGTGAGGEGQPAAPVRPPVAGVRVPGGALDLTALLGQRTPGGTVGAAPAGTAPAPGLPTPELPQPITQLGADGAAASAPVSPLGDLVRRRELVFDAGVLGPVNTAIFRSKGGFLVVSAGQTLPDSNVVVRDVTATGATLALGPETQLLELDPR